MTPQYFPTLFNFYKKNCQIQSNKNFKKQALLELQALGSVSGSITCLLLAHALRTFSLEGLCNCSFPT